MGANAIGVFGAFLYIPVALGTVITTTTPVFSLLLGRCVMGGKIAVPKVSTNLYLNKRK